MDQIGVNGSGTLTEHWNGTAWSVVASPNAGTINSLQSVAAVSANDVWAVGYRYNFTRRTSFIAEYAKVDNNSVGTCVFGQGSLEKPVGVRVPTRMPLK